VEMLDFILEDGLIMIPTLYVLAEIIKMTDIINTRFIPVILLALSIAITPLILTGGYNADNIVQAILIAGATVFSNQVYKQTRSDE